jgi:predicted nucleotide-binding protein (sugar kinase/HSP70/actin superfamily)
MMFAHEIIDTLNDFMLIEEYETMFIINRINEKNKNMFFDNIVYISFIDVMLMFVTRFKKTRFCMKYVQKSNDD